MSDEHYDDHGPSEGVGKYVAIFFALCGLTALSVGAYYGLKDTPKVAWVVMMAVSCCKASLVIMFFMHLYWEANWKYVLTFPAIFMSLFLVLMLVPDVGRRLHHVNRDRALFMATPTAFRPDAEHATDEAGTHEHENGHEHEDEHEHATPEENVEAH